MASCSAQACTHVLGTELPVGDHGLSGAHTPHPWPAAGHSPARSALLMVEQWVGLGPPKRPVGEGNKQSPSSVFLSISMVMDSSGLGSVWAAAEGQLQEMEDAAEAIHSCCF